MTNDMGEWFWGRRGERHWSLAEVARRLGYKNASKGCNITEAGDINGWFHARPDTDPCPLVSAGRQKFLFRTTGFGAVEPYVWGGPTGGPS